MRETHRDSPDTLQCALLQGALLALDLPFVIAGVLKPGYDVILWRMSRTVPLDRDVAPENAPGVKRQYPPAGGEAQ